MALCAIHMNIIFLIVAKILNLLQSTIHNAQQKQNPSSPLTIQTSFIFLWSDSNNNNNEKIERPETEKTIKNEKWESRDSREKDRIICCKPNIPWTNKCYACNNPYLTKTNSCTEPFPFFQLAHKHRRCELHRTNVWLLHLYSKR